MNKGEGGIFRSNEQAVSMGYKKNSSISDISDFTTTCYLYFQFIGSKKKYVHSVNVEMIFAYIVCIYNMNM